MLGMKRSLIPRIILGVSHSSAVSEARCQLTFLESMTTQYAGSNGTEKELSPMPQDYLWDAVVDNWETILAAYSYYEEHKPIVLYDIQEDRIYVYPYKGFKEDLNPRNQANLTEQYETAVVSSKIVVFVRDNDQRRLVSFSIDYESATQIGGESRRTGADRKA
jgi:hypothetical protein